MVCSNKYCPISTFYPSCLCITKIPKTWYCPHCRKFPQFNSKKAKVSKDDNKKQNFTQAMNLDHICTCSSKAEATDTLIKCHNVNCSNGNFFQFVIYWLQKTPKQCWNCSDPSYESDSSNEYSLLGLTHVMNSIFLDPCDEFFTQVVNIGIPKQILGVCFHVSKRGYKIGYELTREEFTGGCQCSGQLPRHGRGWQDYKKLAKVSIDQLKN